jgi:Holliday junction DNA helicase RuvA
MIVRISGILSEVHDGYAVLDRDGIGYEVLACDYACRELEASKGEQVTLHTLEYYEGSTVGGNLTPRLVGFLHADDRAFFTRFITVKGMGVRKAIKALVIPTRQVAAAIESGHAKTLATMPGIGKRMADQIIAELKGKLTEFALGDPDRPPISPAAAPGEAWSQSMRDALEFLAGPMGERRQDAQRWLERALQLHPGDHAADEWVRLAYKVRSTG